MSGSRAGSFEVHLSGDTLSAERKAARIRELNDQFRITLIGGNATMTSGIAALGETIVAQIVETVSNFTNFDADNDPYREHDFGAFEIDGHNIFFKIDLYEEPDVKNPNGEPVVTRVLTIMLAEEY